MIELTPIETRTNDGVVLTLTPAPVITDSRMQFINDGRSIALLLLTGSGATATVTFHTTATINGVPVANRVLNLTTGKYYYTAPFPLNIFGSPVILDYAYGVAGFLKIAILKV